MPRISEETKQRNKEQVLMLLHRHRGLRELEIADLLHIERRTVNNYLNELEREGKVYKDGLNWFADADAGTWLRRFELMADEAFTLYLAARQFVKQTDKQNPMALSALSRLAEVLKTDLPVGAQIFNAAQELRKRQKDTTYEDIFTTVIKAYLLRHPLHLTYRTAHDQTVQTIFKTYLIEPSAIGFTLYLIGHSDHVNALRSYKIERIEAAVPDYNQTYAIPDTFPGLDILHNAWSIMLGETTERVELRFSRHAKKRVLETHWHPSEDYKEELDGALLWWVDVADTTDMKPWIRGWGSDVEVITPDYLRQHLIHTTKQLAGTYKLRPPAQRQPFQWLYAKTNRQNRDQIHLLLYHLIDVGTVAHVMWQTVFTASFRQQIAGLLGVTVAEAGRFVAFMAALHDLGKASPAYQNKYAPPWLGDKFAEIGLLVAKEHYNAKTQKCPHATVTTWALPDLLVEYEGYDNKFARKLSVALGGHHGNWPGPYDVEGIKDNVCPLWDEMRRDLYWEVRAAFPPPQISTEFTPHDLNTLLVLLSGLTSVADWVGSNADYFALEGKVVNTRIYAAQTAVSTQNALQKLGWLGWQPTGKVRDFSHAYAYLNFDEPRRVQQEIIAEAIDTPAPALLIVEAPTGIGKTEIAQYLTDVWLQKHNGRGFYIAMPTQATSNQMYDRTAQFLAHNYPDDLLNLPLVHGNAMFDADQEEIRLNEVGDDEETGVVSMSWFVQKSKQTLLAPFGVGTVDQTLLSVLQTRHFFVRLLGLSYKVIIFDEVHAYDTYMSTLFERLLSWLQAIGASVIMLSATLPSATRQKFVKAYTGQALSVDPQKTIYPALTIAHAAQPPKTIQLTRPQDITLRLNRLPDNSPQAILDFLQTELAGGGCAAVICNTVGRAQAIFELLDQARQQGDLDIQPENLILFHARFPYAWRNPIEKKVLRKFGKPDEKEEDHRPLPPEKAIVVATQVIEQSLDLDFDVMVTDLAPIDLILQRAGRLHRHELRDKERRHPRQLTLTPPDLQDGLPHFGVDEWIYERYLLLQTYRLLQGRQELVIPKETANLIEAVYTDTIQDDDPVWQKALQTAYQKMKLDQRIQASKATRPLVHRPDDYRLLTQTILGLAEDDPAVHQTFQAKTRDIATGVTLICLFQAENGVRLNSDNDTPPFDIHAPLTPDRARALWQNSIAVQNWTLINHFSPQEASVPGSWRKHAVLRYARPVIFVDGVYQFSLNDKSYALCLSQTLGLQLTNLSAPKEDA